jgi:hypothetical protein
MLTLLLKMRYSNGHMTFHSVQMMLEIGIGNASAFTSFLYSFILCIWLVLYRYI